VRAFTEEAFALLRRRWPAIEREARIFVQRILFMTGGMMLGATDVHYQGGILLDAEMRSPVRIAEQIVHEAAHTRLNSIVAGRKLVTNPHTERFSTPLRADTRPMLGLFHQMFVLSRLREFFTRVLVEYPDLESHLQGVCTKLRDAVTTIREHGSLTPAGDALVASIERAMP
jgi:HEXXH motif-containing protein